jgi:hypothetical protein
MSAGYAGTATETGAGLDMGALLAVERGSEVLDFRFSFQDILMWPFVRGPLLLQAFLQEFALSDPYLYQRSWTAGSAARYAWHTLRRHPFAGARGRDVLIFASGISNIRRGATYFNRLHDGFALCFPERTLIVEDSIRGAYRRPRVFPHVRYHDVIHLAGRVLAPLRHLPGKDKRRAREFLLLLRERLPTRLPDKVWMEMEALLLSKGTRLPALHRLYGTLFRRLKPRLLFLEDGCSGSRSYIFKWAREAGIVTAEAQHGIVSRNHPLYNYSPHLADDRYAEYLPHYFLTYGPYWGGQVSMPSRLVPVGNPALSEFQPPRASQRESDCGRLLVISTGVNAEGMFRVVSELAMMTPRRQLQIRFRPHPSEAPAAEERYGGLRQYGVELDTEQDVYTSIHDSDWVAGEISTVLFEARYWDKPVFVLDHPYTRLHLAEGTFPRFQEAGELWSLLSSGTAAQPAPEQFWAPGWRENYERFVQSVAPA